MEALGIRKTFGGTAALGGVDLAVRSGSIHALIGENGAGKSTLIKVLTGVHAPDEGVVRVHGTGRQFRSTQDAIAAGIGAVFQERNLLPHFSVAENLFLHAPPRRAGFLDTARLRRDAREWLDRVGLSLSPDRRAGTLAPAQGQLLEIARALALRACVLLLDEPTASITERDADTLFARLRELRDAGSALLFVSHKLDEVFALCDRVTVIRDGVTVLGDVPTAELTQKDVVTAMVGRAITLGERRPSHSPPPDTAAITPRLSLRGLCTGFGHDRIDLDLHPGRILGLYGLVGAGRTELARAILGQDRITAGTILADNRPIRPASPREALHRHRIGYLSEDRKNDGLILSHPIRHNAAIAIWDRIRDRAGLVSPARERRAVSPVIDSLGVRMASLDQPVGDLSGGNQQKISLAKWIASDVSVLLIDEPSVGVDVRTKEEMYGVIESLAAKGKAILVISSDLAEIVRLADDILVMADRRIVDMLPNTGQYAAISERIMHAIVGAAPPTVVPSSAGASP
ncbi:MAG: sugar ABC transporter ATP-binding protein [Gluconacetobacter diazotrophicus]|nr:sugar ABC transporter ATP-binding protein [Gluconacetobacter diazotrophicus]